METKVKTERIAKLQEKARSLPTKSGCYLMKRRDETIIYVGKAKNLKSRVSSYFNNSAKSPKTEILVSHIVDFDFQLTDTESEALVLENNLIKKFAPKYNIMMRDDKSYPYVVINKKEKFPRLLYQRRVIRGPDKEVYGPFVHGSNISEVLRIITKSFQLRDCTLREFNSRKEPCLLYQIKQCTAPCTDEISIEKYTEDLNLALGFFNGEGEASLKVLNERMESASEKEEFEHAAIIRDCIEILSEFIKQSLQENAEISSIHKNVDVISYYKGDVEIDISLYMIRNGILLGHKNFHFPTLDVEDSVEDVILNYLLQYYTSTYDSLPDLLITDFEKVNQNLFGSAIRSLGKMKVQRPGKDFKSLIKLTQDHAYEHQRVRLSNQESIFVGLGKLKELLGMKERPMKLECYDVAIFQGKSPAASQVVFVDGKPEKKSYRYYHLTELPEGNNDFAMMKEVLSRRIKHGNLPDAFIVDGGKGQVSMFLEVLREYELDIPVAGIAKSKIKPQKSGVKKSGEKYRGEFEKTEERLIIPGRANPYFLSKNKALFRIIVQMRDEAHRFSRKLHHKAEKKRVFDSWLDQVEGVGPKIKEKILRKLDMSQEDLGNLSIEEIKSYLDVTEKVAKNILKVL